MTGIEFMIALVGLMAIAFCLVLAWIPGSGW